MKVARQFIAWKGLTKKARPVGYGLRWFTRTLTAEGGSGTRRPNHTVPYGTVHFLDAFLAVNCQATIISSLRDKSLSETCPHKSIPLQARVIKC